MLKDISLFFFFLSFKIHFYGYWLIHALLKNELNIELNKKERKKKEEFRGM